MTVHQAFESALQHHRAGRLPEADALYRQILQVEPNHAGAQHFLGVIANQVGQHEAAIEMIRRSIVLEPNDATAHSNLGEACRALGRLDEAIASYRRALELRPDWPEVHLNLGIALRLHGLPEAAETAYQRALQLKPNWPEAFNNLGNAQRDRGHLEDATVAYRRAIELKPDYAEAHSNLAVTLVAAERIEEAVAACRRALALQPDRAEAHVNLGNLLTMQGQLDEALAAYQRALELHLNHPTALVNLGNALKSQGRLDEALAAYRSVIRVQPDNAGAWSNLIYALHFQPRRDDSAISVEQECWNRQFSDPVRQFILPHRNARDPERRLRVGYVSPDLRDHVVGRNILPLLRCHDHRQFEVLCYSGIVKPDRMTDELRRCADGWRTTVGVSDERLAEVIRDDGVDILVDLAQHTAENRLAMFARQPAPVQVSFAGYPASAGVEAIPYRLSDRWLEGIGEMQDESVRCADIASREMRPASGVYFLDSFWCFDPCGLEAEIGELPARRNDFVTFGSLNNFCKINGPVLRLWAGLLRHVENSRLVFLSNPGSHRQHTIEFLENLGVENRRVEFLTPCSRRTYLEYYGQLDIVLDPFPYNGHSTSLDALWMGVPVVTLAGEVAVARGGLSILRNLGLPELVARSEDEYAAIATELARDLSRLTELRATLRPRMETSGLMDAPHFARQIEAAYRSMWREWCNG